MLKNHSSITYGRAALAAVAVLLAPSAFAATVATTAADGDLFLGFRQQTAISPNSPAANDLVADIGAFTKYIPVSLGAAYGGTWDGLSFKVSFGVVPGTSTPVTNLASDLSATFGSGWNTNTNNGDGVHWSVAGYRDARGNYSGNTVLYTRAETTPGTLSVKPTVNTGNGGNGTIRSRLNSFVNNNYLLTNSTVNSSVTISEAAGDAFSWNSQLNLQANAFNAAGNIEQPISGAFSGPTNSILDLYLKPGANSSVSTAVQYLGSFSLTNNGELTYSAVPEPGTYAFFVLGTLLFASTWKTRRAKTPQISTPNS